MVFGWSFYWKSNPLTKTSIEWKDEAVSCREGQLGRAVCKGTWGARADVGRCADLSSQLH